MKKRKLTDDELTDEEKAYVERMMRAYQYFIKKGMLVPVPGPNGQPVRRRGEIVYELTKDPELRSQYESHRLKWN